MKIHIIGLVLFVCVIAGCTKQTTQIQQSTEAAAQSESNLPEGYITDPVVQEQEGVEN